MTNKIYTYQIKSSKADSRRTKFPTDIYIYMCYTSNRDMSQLSKQLTNWTRRRRTTTWYPSLRITEMTVYVTTFMTHEINTTTSSHGMFQALLYISSAVMAMSYTGVIYTAPLYSKVPKLTKINSNIHNRRAEKILEVFRFLRWCWWGSMCCDMITHRLVNNYQHIWGTFFPPSSGFKQSKSNSVCMWG